MTFSIRRILQIDRFSLSVLRRVQCGLGHTDSAKVTGSLTTPAPSLLGEKQVIHPLLRGDNTVWLTSLVPPVLPQLPTSLLFKEKIVAKVGCTARKASLIQASIAEL